MKNRRLIIPWAVQKKVKIEKVDKTLGIHFWIKKKKFVDFCSQLVNMNLGFQSPEVIKAIIKQTEKISFIGPKFENENREQLAKILIDLYPGKMDETVACLGTTKNR